MFTILHDLQAIVRKIIATFFQPSRHFSFHPLFLSLILLIPATTCLGGEGQLDQLFADVGLLNLPGKTSGAIGMQPDGKFLVAKAEFTSLSQPRSFTFTRYNHDGSVDYTFANGLVTTDFDGRTNNVTSFAIQANGKIIAAGQRLHEGVSDLVVARYNQDGSLDNSFDLDGKVTVFNFTNSLEFYTAAVQSDGKIVVTSSIGMIRLNANGSIDNSFGVAGRISFPSSLYITSIAVQGDNKIVAVGYANNNFVVNRYNTDGTPDVTFDGDGQAVTDFGGSDGATTVAIQTDGKIVVSGTSTVDGLYFLAVSRYNLNGTPDNSFDGDGKVTVSNNPVGDPVINLQADGKIVVAGGGGGFGVIRLNTNGSPDSTFDGDGVASLAGNNHRTFGAVISGNDVFILGTNYYVGAVVAAFSLENTAINGLTYRYYTGDYNTLPEFNSLLPVKSGLSANVDISVRPAGTSDHFAFVWEGYINITAPGNYTFETVSDDGSKFYFNSFYSPSATALISNDGVHAARSVQGTVNIPAAGLYPVAITYFEKDGGEAMQLYWSGPGIPRQLVPNAAFTTKVEQIDRIVPSTPTHLRAIYTGRTFVKVDWDNSTDNIGVAGYRVYYDGHVVVTTSGSVATIENLVPGSYKYVEVEAVDSAGNTSGRQGLFVLTPISGLYYKFFPNVPYGLVGLESLTPTKAGPTNNVDISVRPSGANENYAFLWEGYINIPRPGTYTFETISDDGSKFYFNSPYYSLEDPLVNNFENNGLHAPISVSKTINIPSAGLYPVAITYDQYGGGQTMQLFWQGPGIARQLVPDAAFTDDSRPAFLTNGLNYKYYEGNWTTLPDFTALTPVQTGRSATTDISKRPAGKNDNFAFVWEGYITLLYEGTYTFETVSDDGSKLYFNSKYIPSAVATVDNNGLHAAVSAKANVSVSAAGTYPIAITFFENTGDQKMEVYWSGPNITRQLIPAEAFSTDPSTLIERINYRTYSGSWTTLPDFNTLSLVKTGFSPNIDIATSKPAGSDNLFATVWQGFISIQTPGNYTFETVSDDGSKLYFNDPYWDASSVPLVNNDGVHPVRSASATVNIPNAGVYPISVSYFQQYGGQSVEVYWTGPGIPRQRIPTEAFALVNGPAFPFNFPGPVIQNSGTLSSAVVNEQLQPGGVYPNPFSEYVTVDFYNSSLTNDISIGIFDLNGRKVFENHPGRLGVGNNTITMNLKGLKINDGVYIVQIQKNGIPWKTSKIVKMKK